MLWNTGAFFVLFREALEAAIILGVLHRFIEQTMTDPSMKQKAKRNIWMGALLGLVISLTMSILLTIAFYTLQKDLFGKMKPLFEGTLQLIAVILLTWLSFKMLKSSILYRKWEEKIAFAAKKQSKQAKAFMVLSFSIIIREGLESLGGGNPKSLILPGILGIFIGSLMGYLLYRCSGKVNLRAFFVGSSILLFIIAAGLMANAFAEYEEYFYDHVINYNVEGADEGINEDEPLGEINDSIPSPIVLWDVCGWGDEDIYPFFQVMRTLVGWRCRPTLMTTCSYFGYWLIVFCKFLKKLLKK